MTTIIVVVATLVICLVVLVNALDTTEPSDKEPAEPRVRRVFASYSRDDGTKVYPLVSLLRAAGEMHVFVDLDSIPPGEKWELSTSA